jgi:hypothetical protein
VHIVPKDHAVLDFICQALRKSFVFTGIKDDLLREVGHARLLLVAMPCAAAGPL